MKCLAPTLFLIGITLIGYGIYSFIGYETNLGTIEWQDFGIISHIEYYFSYTNIHNNYTIVTRNHGIIYIEYEITPSFLGCFGMQLKDKYSISLRVNETIAITKYKLCQYGVTKLE